MTQNLKETRGQDSPKNLTQNGVKILESAFITSATSSKNAPAPSITEIVFLGRSNVGKSSLINALLNAPLAKSSATPGKTQLINFFSSLWLKENQKIPLCFVDLPGFGYAKVSKSIKKEWEKNLLSFLLSRQSIKLFLHLVDSRHTDLEIDKSVEAFLQEICKGDQKILRIYTKADKLKQNALSSLQCKLTQQNILDSQTQSYLCSITAKNHKITSIPALREKILDFTLGVENDI